jgi:hypothetical protein
VIIPLLLSLLMLSSQAQVNPEDCNCRSELLRVEIADSVLNGDSAENGKGFALAALESFFSSPVFKSSFIKSYPLETIGFPHNDVVCKEEVKDDPKFKGVDCSNPYMCSDPNISEAVKKEVCLTLPCSFVMADINACKSSNDKARFTKINFPQPLEIKELELEPLSFQLQGDSVRSCFKVKKMNLSVGVEVESERTHINYPTIGLTDLTMALDHEEEVCMVATIRSGQTPPLSNVTIESNGQFVSNQMINTTLRSATITGMTGVPQDFLNSVKRNVLPSFGMQLRPKLEEAVKRSLGSTFENQLNTWMGGNATPGILPGDNGSSVSTLMSELGAANMSYKKYVDLMECSLLKKQRRTIPSDHGCFKSTYPFGGDNLKLKEIPKPEKAAEMLGDQARRFDQISSESQRLRLKGFEESFKNLGLSNHFRNHVSPVIEAIRFNQSQPAFSNGFALLTEIGQNGLGIRGVVPGICDDTKPSPHAGRSMDSCPIQAYMDLDELNNILGEMFNSGRLCHQGRGPFVAQVDNNGNQAFDKKDVPLGSGCRLIFEEKEGGFSCFMGEAPKFDYDSVTGTYKIVMRTKQCFRGGVFLGQGKIGGDINFTFPFKPDVCDGGDFCLKNIDPQWEVVLGSERFALRDGSFLSGMVKDKIDEQLKEQIGDTFRLKLSGSGGKLSSIPFEAEGRVDKGRGFFGACLQPIATKK